MTSVFPDAAAGGIAGCQRKLPAIRPTPATTNTVNIELRMTGRRMMGSLVDRLPGHHVRPSPQPSPGALGEGERVCNVPECRVDYGAIMRAGAQPSHR